MIRGARALTLLGVAWAPMANATPQAPGTAGPKTAHRGAAAQPRTGLSAVAAAIVAAQVPATDDPDHLAQQLLETAITAATSPTTELLVEEARRLLPALQRPAECLRHVAALLAAKPHALGARAARSLEASLLVRLGRKQDALALRTYAGQADALIAIGPLGDEGDDFNGMVLSPEFAFPAAGTTLAGRYGPVQPRVVRRRPMQRLIDLAPRSQPHSGCFYGLHQVEATEDVSCYLELVCPGSFELFVNGERSQHLNRRIRRIPPIVRIPIALGAGLNHVLVKTTTNSRSELGLRYIDAAGRAVTGLTPLGDRSTIRPHRAPVELVADAPFRDGLSALEDAAKRAAPPTRTMLALAATLAAFRSQDIERGIRVLNLLEAAPPTEGIPALAFARALEAATPLPAEIRRARARRIVERVTAELPEHHHALMQRARHLQDQDRREAAVRLLQARVTSGDAGPATFNSLHRMLRSLRFKAEATRLLRTWRAACPGDARPLLALLRDREGGGDARGALAQAVKALETLPHDTVRRRALRLATRLGDAATTLAQLDALYAFEPDGLAALVARSTALRGLGRTSAAVAIDRRIAELETADAAAVRLAADRLLAAGADGAALAAHRRSLALDPSQHDLRRLIARLEGREELAEFTRFRRDASALIAAFEPTERERGATSSLLLDQMLVRIYADGSMAEETHQLRRINDLRGVAQYQKAAAAARADEVVTVRTIGKDGSNYVPNRVADSFEMPRLEPGAFIEVKYRPTIDHQSQGLGARPSSTSPAATNRSCSPNSWSCSPSTTRAASASGTSQPSQW